MARDNDFGIVRMRAFGTYYFRIVDPKLFLKEVAKMIRVYADLETCFTRVKTRNNVEHIAVSDDKVTEFNKIAAGVTYDWKLEINNNNLASDTEILNAIRSINDVEPE